MSQLRSKSKYRKGHDDGLEPLEPLDLAASNTVDALVRGMANTAFGGRSLGEAADVLETMVRDDDCFRVVTISGAMTIAKQGLVLCEMMERGWVQAIVTTGALMTHGLVEGAGMQHFKHRPSLDDTTLFERGYNRVYDTIELEQNLDDAYSILSHTFRDAPGGTVLSSRTILEQIGQHLNVNVKGRAILGVAAERNIPIYVPAFTDSELGLDLAVFNQQRTRDGKQTVGFDPFLDLNDFAKRVNEHETLGIFT
ncbi:MAG: deoxyhypusine synthase family protein, partial [bacterium]